MPPGGTSSGETRFEARALLDTSAFKALSRDQLASAQLKGWHLLTSPYCFWELLSHLDEQQPFAKAKGNLMKYRGVEIVDKPLDRLVARSKTSAEPRIWSSDLAYAALAAIDAAESFDDMKRSVIKDDAGNHRGPLGDCAARARAALAEAEVKFQEVMGEVIEVLRSGQAGASTLIEKHDAVTDMVSARGTPWSDTPDVRREEGATEDQILAHSYVYWAYVLLRAKDLADIGATTCARNDFEDGQLCAYVPLDEPLWVVSGDKKLLDVLIETRNILVPVGLGSRAAFRPAKPDLLLEGRSSP